MKKVCLIKFGGSLLTDKTKRNEMNLAIMKRLIGELSEVRMKQNTPLILAHGAGSFAHGEAVIYQTQKGFINKNSLLGFAKVADVAATFNRYILRELLDYGIPAISVSPLSFLTAANGEVHSAFFDSIDTLLRTGVMPVVYGDVIADVEQGCTIFSGEKILRTLATASKGKYQIEHVILLSDTDGVLDASAQTIPTITPKNFHRISSLLGEAKGFDVTGGMRHKVMEAIALAKEGIPSVILNGRTRGNLTKALLGEPVKGTVISADERNFVVV
jgi:isopentenyl phosphate kinase